jgi:hypothetical protein
MWNFPKQSAFARRADGLFFPQRELLGIGRERFSPAVKTKAVSAAAHAKSFAQAQTLMEMLGEITMSDRHLGRLAHEAGQKLLDEQRDRARRHARNELGVEVENLPELAVVEMDGGRIRTRKEGQGQGTHDPAWRESKNALFQRMTSETHACDPCPELPDFLKNRGHIRQLVLEMSGTADGVDVPENEEPVPDEPIRHEPPKRLMRTCLSSLDDSDTFGELMAAEAKRKGFYEAKRQAFVADGMKCNWTVQKRHFAAFTPIVDLLHVVSYLYHAAVAIGESEDFGWGLCVEWTRACWQGRVTEVIADLTDWLSDQPPLEDDVPDADPRKIVRTSQIYLNNNVSRMDYPKYRREGLPLTSVLVESLIKEINYRVKGTEKFWNDPSGADPILALKAASLSDDQRLEKLLTQ